jgi:hypothetical protein
LGRQRVLALAGTVSVVGGLLFLPGVWSGLTTAYSSTNQSLPAAYSGVASNPVNRGGLNVNMALLDYLQANTQGMTYLMAVPSSMQGSDYVIATGRPVLYMGGFMGQDAVIDASGLAALVAEGQLRFIYSDAGRTAGAGGGARGLTNPSQSGVAAWLVTNCTPVTGFETAAQNSGTGQPAGDGQGGRAGGGLRAAGDAVRLRRLKGQGTSARELTGPPSRCSAALMFGRPESGHLAGHARA